MIEISFAKLLVLALIALIVLGPEKLPVVARTAGALIRRVRNGWDTVRAEVERELEIEEIRGAAKELVAQKDAVEASLNSALKQVKDVADTSTSSHVTLQPSATPVQPAIAQDDHAVAALPADAAASMDGQSAPVARATAAGVDDLFPSALTPGTPSAAQAAVTPELAHGNH